MMDSFVFYRSFWDGIKDLPQESFVRLVSAICAYALDDVEPDLSGLEMAVFRSWQANVDASQKRRENGRRGGRPKKDIPEPLVTEEKTNGFESENQWMRDEKPNKKEKKKENTKENDNISARFSKPTVDEVRAYCQERKNNIDPEQFWNYYEAKGWKIGKAPMKSWKACVVTWERYDKQRKSTGGKKPNPFLQMDAHEYDFDALEKELLAN